MNDDDGLRGVNESIKSAKKYADYLAKSLYAKLKGLPRCEGDENYEPDFILEDSVLGVLTQIDHLAAALSRNYTVMRIRN